MNLNTIFFGNSVYDYLIAVALLILISAVVLVVKKTILWRLRQWSKKTANRYDDLVIGLIARIRWYFYGAIALYFSFGRLNLTEVFEKWLGYLVIVVIVVQSLFLLHQVVDFFVKRKFADDDPQSQNTASVFAGLLKAFLWVIGLILVLNNFGIEVTSLIAGLGIGGIAVALAVQNILGDLFSSFAIYFDKPFEVGDLISVGEHLGTVEKIGIKTTRIRALQGEEVVISNKELTSAQIQNFKKLDERRISFDIGVLYETSKENLKEVTEIIKDSVEETDKVRFERSHFKAFGDSALIFETVYTVLSTEYEDYMNVQESINFKVYEKFKEKGIEMAYPTQTLYLSKN